MKLDMKALMAFALAFAWATGLVFAIGHYTDGGRGATERECANLAWRVANRSHSILESEAFRQTQGQAFRTCLSDPSAFRHLVNRGS